MAKKKALVFERSSRKSGPAGEVEKYRSNMNISRAMGQGDIVIFHGYVHTRTSNAKLAFEAKSGAFRNVPPAENGFATTLTGTFDGITALGPFTFRTSVTFDAVLDLVMKVSEDTPGSIQESVDAEVWCTVITDQ